MPKAFYAYPGKPDEIAQTIGAAVEKFNRTDNDVSLDPWVQNDISGIPLTAPIFEKIEASPYVAADITFMNENVAFEIGYAIGKGKRCLLHRSSAFEGDKDLAASVGVFDTLGYEEYSTSDELVNLLSSRSEFNAIPIDLQTNHKAPVYIVEPPVRTEVFGTLVSRVKKARWFYRSFIPSEDIRLSAIDAISHVSQSAGVISLLLPDGAVRQREHNIRAMFVAGISLALEIPTLIIHTAEFTPPMDVRDLTNKFRHPDDIRDIVQEFSLEITSFSQRDEKAVTTKGNVLSQLKIGDPAAENEMTTLSRYYLKTDDYQRALRGEVNLVVGRKGAGKTALFVQLRNNKRNKKKNIVIDLRPEGYQLIKLKERVLDHLSSGAQQHLITAFWEYLLLLEITYKVLEKDRTVHLRDHLLTEKYIELRETYESSDLEVEGDFSERFTNLANHITNDYGRKFGDDTDGNITTHQVTELLHKHDIRKLFDLLTDYLQFKGEVWLLFDNIDKGWNTEGVSETDIFVLRCLVDASRKLERNLRKKDIDYHSVIFVRDDVYTLLMEGSADYGKELRATLDWSDRNLLSEVLRKRVVYSLSEDDDVEFSSIWNQIAVSHCFGEASMDFMIDRSLMRPRNLLKIFRHCLGNAINLGHDRIQVEDIARGLRTYSQDVVTEVDRELTDVFPAARRLIYEFSEENSQFSHEELSMLIILFGLSDSDAEKAISFLLYYGLIGVKKSEDEPLYIYDVNYDIEMLRVRIRKWGATTQYVVNPALWPALNVGTGDQLTLV